MNRIAQRDREPPPADTVGVDSWRLSNTVTGSWGLQAGAQSYGYAFIFSQQGLMAGISIEGTKVTKIER